MPKIVPDIQNKILSVAERHFRNLGFEKADMRAIALEADLAVGTIYLHYQSKEALFQEVVARSWRNTIEKIEKISTLNEDPCELLKRVLLELAQDMENRKSLNSLWMEVRSFHHHKKVDLPEEGNFSGLHDPISRVIGNILRKMSGKDQNKISGPTFDQLGSFGFIMTVDTCMLPADGLDDRLALIVDLLTAYIRTIKNK
ncbi:MAG: TetR/AcrR family transcriptional regulator [Chloroflexi bacterium]|nr:TetR/AcrR family transcriptional regulator [Chloroflexota bacterium]